MRDLLSRFKSQSYWVSSSIVLTAVWMAFIYLFNPSEIGLIATAFATACLIALIQNHFKKK